MKPIDRLDRRARLLEDDRDRQRRGLRLQREEDVVIDGRKLKLRSPDGTYFSIQVADDGTLSTTDEGPTL